MPTRIPTPTELPILRSTAASAEDNEQALAEGTHVSPFIGKGTRDDVSERVPTNPPIGPEVAERVTLIAHDVKTPLSIILLEAQLLVERLPADVEPGVVRSIERIAQNAAYIDRLIADLLDLAAVDAGQLELRLETVVLAALLEETIERAVSTFDRHRVELDVRAPVRVSGDCNRLERVIANFISNALKYSSSTVTIVLECNDARARVTVIDRGRGLTTEQAGTVFDRYRRAGNTKSHAGYGLGLYISRKIIDAHAGRIGVTSTPGGGSEFYFELDAI